MARKIDLMGFGMSPFLAERIATEPTIITAVGATRASAYALGRSQFLVQAVNSNSGAGILLPPLGGDSGCLLGDDFIINNQITGGVTVYGQAGTTLDCLGTATSGSGGVSLSSHTTATFYPITASTWVAVAGS